MAAFWSQPYGTNGAPFFSLKDYDTPEKCLAAAAAWQKKRNIVGVKNKQDIQVTKKTFTCELMDGYLCTQLAATQGRPQDQALKIIGLQGSG